MKRIVQLFDTACIFIGNLLRLKPTGWTASKEAAEGMRVAFDNLTEQGADGKRIAMQKPINYLIDSVLNVLALALGVWLIAKIVSGFFAMLPYLLAIAVIAWIISALTSTKEGDVVAS